MSVGGKGSRSRPLSISQREYDTRWDAIFGRESIDTDVTSADDKTSVVHALQEVEALNTNVIDVNKK